MSLLEFSSFYYFSPVCCFRCCFSLFATSSLWRRLGGRIGTSESQSTTSCLGSSLSVFGRFASLLVEIRHRPRALIRCNKRPLEMEMFFFKQIYLSVFVVAFFFLSIHNNCVRKRMKEEERISRLE